MTKKQLNCVLKSDSCSQAKLDLIIREFVSGNKRTLVKAIAKSSKAAVFFDKVLLETSNPYCVSYILDIVNSIETKYPELFKKFLPAKLYAEKKLEDLEQELIKMLESVGFES